MEDSTLLVTLYCYVDQQFSSGLADSIQRFSNNNKPDFTDVEVVTIYLFGIIKKIREIKEIHKFMNSYYANWFPNLPTYEKYVYRLNRICSVFPDLCGLIINDFAKKDVIKNVLLIDSMPIIMANQKRSTKAKVADFYANKGHCASKGIYYYGAKLHVLGKKRQATLPLPEYLLLTPASNHDLELFEYIASNIHGRQVFADKAYIKAALKTALKKQNTTLNTPVKKEKGQKYLDLFQQLISAEVSRIRQPIESFFNWIEEKTGVQKASKVRSSQGLMTHVFGRLAAAMFLLVFH